MSLSRTIPRLGRASTSLEAHVGGLQIRPTRLIPAGSLPPRPLSRLGYRTSTASGPQSRPLRHPESSGLLTPLPKGDRPIAHAPDNLQLTTLSSTHNNRVLDYRIPFIINRSTPRWSAWPRPRQSTSTALGLSPRHIHVSRHRDHPNTPPREPPPPSSRDPLSSSPNQTHGTPNPQPQHTPKPGEPPPDLNAESIATSVSRYLHLDQLQTYMHRPTKEELLSAATGFWSRLRIRFKWFSIRSVRPWNADEWGAFVSMFLFGHLVWILVGTTTFISVAVWFINTVFAQEKLAKWVGDYLTRHAGITVVFESAIVPKWGNGVISFHNVFVSRRPGQVKSSVSKGSSSNAAAVAAAGRHVDTGVANATPATVDDDGNYTQFDITINSVDVTLSFVKWWNGKGLLKDVEVKGVRGVVDRTSVVWHDIGVDPLSYRQEHQPGDFEIDSFRMEDLLLTIHQPNDFRPFSVSIYSCELPQLRKQFLFYDFLSATHMSGSFDGSLFTIHPRQVQGTADATGLERDFDLGEPGAWKKCSRLRIDALRIDHLNRGVEGIFGWIYEGNVDIVADILFPADPDDSIAKVMTEFYEKLEEAVTSKRYLSIMGEDASAKPDRGGAEGDGNSEAIWNLPAAPMPIQDQPMQVIEAPTEAKHPTAASKDAAHAEGEQAGAPTAATDDEGDRRYVVMDLRVHLNDVKAAVPLFTHDISYVNQALVRPIVAYINAKRTYIPISCRIVKRAGDFDGAWSVFDSGLMSDLSAETYDAFARDVEDQHNRVRRLRKVGFWTLSLAVHALFMGMAGSVA